MVDRRWTCYAYAAETARAKTLAGAELKILGNAYHHFGYSRRMQWQGVFRDPPGTPFAHRPMAKLIMNRLKRGDLILMIRFRSFFGNSTDLLPLLKMIAARGAGFHALRERICVRPRRIRAFLHEAAVIRSLTPPPGAFLAPRGFRSEPDGSISPDLKELRLARLIALLSVHCPHRTAVADWLASWNVRDPRTGGPLKIIGVSRFIGAWRCLRELHRLDADGQIDAKEVPAAWLEAARHPLIARHLTGLPPSLLALDSLKSKSP